MNSSNTKLKPLDHKKSANNNINSLLTNNSKTIGKTVTNTTQEKKKTVEVSSQ